MKLIKNSFDGWSHYYLKNDDGDTIGTTKHPFPPETILMAKGKGIELLKLSHENCEFIERGYNIDELITKELSKLPYEKHVDDGQYNDGQRVGFELGAYWAFQKALELIGNEKFTERDILKVVTHVLNELVLIEGFEKQYLFPESIFQEITTKCKSLQKTEWDVKVVTELVGTCGGNDDGCFMESPGHNCGCYTQKPKLDKNGCVVLTKLMNF